MRYKNWCFFTTLAGFAMIDETKLDRAAYAIFETSMAQQRVPHRYSNQSINEYWEMTWEHERANYRAQAIAAFVAAGLLPPSPPG